MNRPSTDNSASSGRKAWYQAFSVSAQTLATALFILRTLIAAFLALWVSMRLGLDKPATAMTTVIIVAQPQSGLVLAKSVYRALGTLIGCAMTLLFLAIFAQQRELFIAVIALWVGLCAAGAARFRGFKAYGFILAGYTTCMIGFPAVQQVDATYAIALSRVSEVLIGIFCAGVVADVFFPQRLAPGMVSLVRKSYTDLAQLLLDTLTGQLDKSQSTQRHAQLTADILRLESLRASAYFEDAETRLRNERLQQLTVDFMALLSSLHALERLLARQATGARDLRQHLQTCAQPLLALLHNPPANAAEALAMLPNLESQVQALDTLQDSDRNLVSASQGFERETAIDLLQQLGWELLTYTRTYAALAKIHAASDKQSLVASERFVPHADLITALASGGRAALALVLVSSFWIAADWPGGAGAALNACVVCCFFAAAPAPVLATKQMMAGTLMAVLMSWFYSLVLQPHFSGDFEMLVLLLSPLLAPGLWLAAQPNIAGLGTAYCLFFSILSAPQSASIIDPAALLNQGLSLIAGMLAGALAFSVFIPAEGELRMRRLLNGLRSQLAQACKRPLAGLRARFESQCRDLQAQILATSDLPPQRVNEAQNYGLSVLEIGHAVLDTRRCLEQHSSLMTWQPAVAQLLDNLGLLALELTQENRQLVLLQLEKLMRQLNTTPITTPIKGSGDEDGNGDAQRRLHSALFRLHAGLMDAADFSQPLDHPTDGAENKPGPINARGADHGA